MRCPCSPAARRKLILEIHMHFNIRRRDTARLLAIAASLAALGTPAMARDDDDGGFRQGKLFISTNASSGNALQVYARSASGPASLFANLPTGGTGTGAGLDSQGAVTLSASGLYLSRVCGMSSSVIGKSLRDKLPNTEAARAMNCASGHEASFADENVNFAAQLSHLPWQLALRTRASLEQAGGNATSA